MAPAYLRPPWFLEVVGNRIATLVGSPVLEVPGRRSGAPRQVPLNVLDHGGERYLVAPRGETEWVRNLRVADTAHLKTRRKGETIRAVEVPVAERADLIALYRAKWDGATTVQWEALPDPADHPIFRIAHADV